MPQEGHQHMYLECLPAGGSVQRDLDTPGDLANRNLKVEKEKLQNNSRQQYGQ